MTTRLRRSRRDFARKIALVELRIGDLNRQSPTFWHEREELQNERADYEQFFLREKARKIGLEIPIEYWKTTDKDFWSALTPDGVHWINHKIREHNRTILKDRVAIVLPILSLLLSSTIAILGLLVAMGKK